MRVVAHREVHEDGSDVVGNTAIFLVHLAECMTHHDVREEWQRRMRRLPGFHQRLGKTGIIEECIEPLTSKELLCGGVLGIRSTRHKAQRKLRIVACQALSNVGQNQENLLEPQHQHQHQHQQAVPVASAAAISNQLLC